MSLQHLSAGILGLVLLGPAAVAPAAAQTPQAPAAAPDQSGALPPPPVYQQPGQPAQAGQGYYQPPPPGYPQQTTTYQQPTYQPPPPNAYPPGYGQQPVYQPPPNAYPPGYGQPGYGQPTPTYVQPNYAAGYPAVRYRPTPAWRPQFGLGLRASGLYTGNSFLGFGQGGIGGELLLRVHRRWTLELSLQYQRISEDDYNYLYYYRQDVPITVGARVHLGNPLWILSPYVAFAGGADYAWLSTPDGSQSAWFFEGQFGLGLELRLGRHFAFNMDLRGLARLRSLTNNELYVDDGYGVAVPALGNQGGVAFNFGLAGYF